MQCITCLYTTTYQQPKGKGLCLESVSVLGLLDKRECKAWKLSPMAMVRARMVRRIVFDADGIANLMSGGNSND